MPFEAGYNKWAAWKVSGAGAASLLQVTDHTWKEAVDKLDFSHTGSEGIQALLAGLLRGTGTVKAKFNSTTMPSGAPSIKAGNRGQLQLFLGGALPFYIPGMITEVQYQSAVAGAVEYQFTVELDHNAIAVSGSYQYPA